MAGIENIAINYNMNKIYKDYPKSILPVKFSKRTGKALKCQFEELDLNLYDKEARMVTFHTSPDRLYPWIKTLAVFYYDHLGKSPEYKVNWHDDPSVWSDPNDHGNSIVIDLLDSSDNFLYGVTFFVTTGTIRAQGAQYKQFVTKHFPIIKGIFARVLDVLNLATEANDDLNKTITQDDSAIESQHDNQTLLKCVAPIVSNENVESRPAPSVTETNVKHVESQPATDDVQVPVTQLSALENTITSALSSLEQSNWSNSLRIISHIDELGKAVLVQQKSVSNNTESLNSKIQYQKEHISTLQEQLQTERHNLSMKVKQSNQDEDLLRKKLASKDDEIEFLTNKLDKVSSRLDQAQDEIISLKSHIAAAESEPMANMQRTEAKAKAKVLLVGTSNVGNIKEDKLTLYAETTKVIKYTMRDTHEFIDTFQNVPDVVVLHCLTNDLKTMNPQSCVDALEEIVATIQSKWNTSKIVISLCTPRSDSIIHQTNAQIINALIKQRIAVNVRNILLCEHNNMLSYDGMPAPDVLSEDDQFHLSNKGTALLASNIKQSIHTALGLPTPPTRGRSPGRRGRGGYGRGRGRGRGISNHQ